MVDPDPNTDWLPPDAGDMGTSIRAFDWSSTELGPLKAWPVGLRTVVSVMLESENVMSLVWGDEAILIYNDAFANRLLPPQWRVSALGASAYKIVGTDESSFAADIAAGMAGQSRQVHGKHYPVLRDGVVEDAWFNVTYAPVRDAGGEVDGVLWTLIEITEQWQAQETLRESEARSRTLIGSWAQAVWETDPDGVVIADSPSWRAYTGQTLQEWFGYGWLDAIHPDDREYVERQWRAAFAVEGLVDAEFRLRAPDGGWRWTNLRATPVRDANDRIQKWAGMNIDIDVRKRIEATLRESEARQAFLLKLGDALRALADAAAIQNTATRLLAEHFGASHAFYIDVDGTMGDERATASGQYTSPGTTPWPPQFRLADFGPALIAEYRAGRPVVSPDLGTDPRIEPAVRRNYGAVDAAATIGVPLVKEGCWVASFGLVTPQPREWTGGDVALVQDVAERTWAAVERARAEEAVRRSERRLRALFESIDEGYSEMQVILNEEGQVVDWLHLALNGNFSRVTGIPDITGRLASDVFPTLEGEWFRRMDLAYRTGEPQRFETELADLGRWFDNYITRVDGESDLVLGVFGDITERKVAERTLRESEERFRQFGRASSDGLWIRDAETLKLEYASDAMKAIYGLSIAAMTADPLAWPALIVPEDRDETFGYIERVKAGESVVHEFRIQRPTDLTFRWIRSVGFPLLDEKGVVTRIAGISSDITEEKILVEHQGVLLHELQHRVRNIMGVIRSIGNRSAAGATGVEDYRQTLEGRMLALARVQTLLTREANTGGSLRDIIESEVKVQAHHPHQYALVGTDVILSPKAVEVLTMAFHELSTNALKYGAFSVSEGRLTVSWSKFVKHGSAWLGIDWVETGAPQRQTSTRRGFGSELIEGRIPYELGGSGKVMLEAAGARCRIEFPLKFADSILETDAPMPTTTFGGTIDMSGAPDLSGCVVLVVEDDYYMAADTVAALRGAGAEVLGPCPNEEATRELLEASMPTHAVLDLNLGGGGPRFEIAHLLKTKRLPFIFVTGYDPDVIPADLTDVPRLQKPVPFRKIVEAISLL